MFSKCAEENKFYEISWNDLIDSLKEDSIYSYLIKQGFSQSGKSKESFLLFGTPETENVEVELETLTESAKGDTYDMSGVREVHTYEFVRDLTDSDEMEYAYLMIQYDSYFHDNEDDIPMCAEDDENNFEPDLVLFQGRLFNNQDFDCCEELCTYMTNVKIFVMKNHGQNQGMSVINGIERPLIKNKFTSVGAKNFFELDDDILFNWNLGGKETIVEGRFTLERAEFAMKYLADHGYQYRGNLKCPMSGKRPVRLQFVNYDIYRGVLLDVDEESICLEKCKNITSNFLVEIPIPELDIYNAGNPDWLVELLRKYCLIQEVNAILQIVTIGADLNGESSESDKLKFWEYMHDILEQEDYRYDEDAELFISPSGYSVVELYYDSDCSDTLPFAIFYDSFGKTKAVSYTVCRF